MEFKIMKRRKEKSGFYVNVTFMHGDDDARDHVTFGPMDETVFTLFCKALHRMQTIGRGIEDSIERLIWEQEEYGEMGYCDLERRYKDEPQTFTDEIPEEDLKQYLDPDIFKRIKAIEYHHPWCGFTYHVPRVWDFNATCVEDGRRYEVKLSFK